MRMTHFIAVMIVVFVVFTNSEAQQPHQAEVIHWWVSGGEQAALRVVIDEFESRGHTWIDTPVEASYQAKTAALSRLFEGRPPTIVQWHVGVTIQDLYHEGLLRDIQDLAESGGWRDALPEVIWKYITVDGRIVAVPLTLHGSNWIWANRKVLESAGVNMPTTWDELIVIAPKIREAGFIPLALGGQPWQETLLFLNVALAVGGADFYNAAFVEHDPEALSGETMVKAFEVFGSLRSFVDAESPGRGWAETTKLVISGKAAFQVMGDWAKGEFIQANMIAGEDFECAFCPGTAGHYLAVSDAFAMVAVKDTQAIEAQKILADILMEPEVQRRFNLLKGSIPPRNDVSREGFDECARLAFAATEKGKNVLAGLNMANPEIVASAILDTVSSFWNTPDASPSEAAKALASAVEETSF